MGGVEAVCQPHALSPPCPLASASPRRGGQGGGGARRAHMVVSAVRAPSCVGRLPLRKFHIRSLRAIRGTSGGGARGEGEVWRGMRGGEAVCQPHVLSPSCPLAPASPRRRGQGGGRARRAHICVSAVRAPSCVGRLPLRLFSRRSLRAKRGTSWGVRGVRGSGWRGAGGVGGMGGVRAWEVCGGVPWAGGGVSQVVGAVVGRQGRRDHEKG